MKESWLVLTVSKLWRACVCMYASVCMYVCVVDTEQRPFIRQALTT